MTDTRIETLLAWWFADWTEDGPMDWGSDPALKRWWKADPAIDATIRERFGPWLEALRGPAGEAWAETPRGALARVLLLDQVSRVMHRGSGRAWENDAVARATVYAVLEAGWDAQLEWIERQFLLMPLMHSEDRADHDRAELEFARLAADTAGSQRAGNYTNLVDYEQKHRAIVDRFGRYPHRNALLGRESTPEEQAFLQEDGSSF